MRALRLWLTDFRSYTEAELVPAADGLTIVIGPNGEGKTNLLEAVAFLATLSSFRSAPDEALVRQGAAAAIVRAEVESGGRTVLIEAEIRPGGRNRVQVNRQPLRRARDLLGVFRATVFSPDDLVLVKGGPAERRRYLDEVLVALHAKHDALQHDLERILRQRNALLRQVAGTPSRRLSEDAVATLDVWDAKLAATGEEVASTRERLVTRLEPEVAKAYDQIASAAADIGFAYARSWSGDLAGALAAAREDDLRRGVTTVGPHRDELEVRIGGLPARTHASQGEQRSLALALRLGAHRAVTEDVGEAPVLLLDDVFSELDPDRCDALLAHLPPGQALLTTAGVVPSAAVAAATVRIGGGRVWP